MNGVNHGSIVGSLYNNECNLSRDEKKANDFLHGRRVVKVREDGVTYGAVAFSTGQQFQQRFQLQLNSWPNRRDVNEGPHPMETGRLKGVGIGSTCNDRLRVTMVRRCRQQ